MKAVILAGGLGTRLAEETTVKPKPMVEIGSRPVLWHILKSYSHHGINDFVICLGYRGYVIKEYFANYFLHMSDVTFCLSENRMEICQPPPLRTLARDAGRCRQTYAHSGRLMRVHDRGFRQRACRRPPSPGLCSLGRGGGACGRDKHPANATARSIAMRRRAGSSPA